MSQVFFATFFGFLGLLLALPLTVVGQVWLQEILIKDVLDLWTEEEHPPHLGEAFVEEVEPIASPPIAMVKDRPEVIAHPSINVDPTSMIIIEGQRPSSRQDEDS